MTETEKAALLTLSPEALVEGFVTEAKLSEPAMALSVAAMQEHSYRSFDYIDVIKERGGLLSLVSLLDSSDDWIAFRTAEHLALVDATKDRALIVLDRIADACSGATSFSADTARNMVRYGHPSGDPIETEKRLAIIRARETSRRG